MRLARVTTLEAANRYLEVRARDAETASVAPGSPVVVERRLSGAPRLRL